MRFALVVFCAVLAGCGRDPSSTVPPPHEVPQTRRENGLVEIPSGSPQLARLQVEPVTVERMPLDEVVAPGRVMAIPTRVSRVVMPAPGRITRVLVGLGDSVTRGQTLLTLESAEVGGMLAGWQQAEARVKEAEAALIKNEADLERVRDLFQHRAIAQKEVVSTEAALAQALSDLTQAKAARQESLWRLSVLGLTPDAREQELAIRSPLNSKVLSIDVTSGEFRADTSAPLMTLADLSSVYISADVPESLIRLVTTGEHIEAELDAYPGEIFAGRVARIADLVNPETRTVQVLAELKNPQGRLRPDMFGVIRHEDTFRSVPVAPEGAVIQRQNRTALWRERSPGVFESVEVKTGRPRKGLVPILEGIRSGDRIVVDGAMLLEGGS